MSERMRLGAVNLIARDVAALSAFYAQLFGFAEIVGHRSPIYRCLDAGGFELGFNAEQAYDLLALGDRRSGEGPAPVRCFATFEAPASEVVDVTAERCLTLGGRVCKAPSLTYYNGWQAVLADPEHNVFRVNFRRGPRIPAADLADPPWSASS